METESFVRELMPLLISGVAIMTLIGMTFVFYIQFLNKRLFTEQKNRQKLMMKHQEELIQNNIISQEKERHRIAQDLHDDIGSKLNVMHLYIHNVINKVDKEEARELLFEIDKLLKKAINSTRNISHNLLPPTLSSLGIFSAIQELVEEITGSSNIEVNFTASGNERIRLKSKIAEVNIFRIIQEWISNSLKQSATHIFLDITHRNDLIIISYEDNGPGYDPDSTSLLSGMGLRNINNRVNMMKASMRNLSALGQSAKYILTYKISNQ